MSDIIDINIVEQCENVVVNISECGGMVYPSVGIALSTGSSWGASITDNSTNWNTAYSWGNHASAGYLTGITSAMIVTALGFTPYSASNPNGYISGINSGMVTTALGFTPYNATNPAGYITASALTGYATESYVNSQGFVTANAGLNALLPSQTGNGGKVLSTDGTNTSWIASGGSALNAITGAVASANIDSGANSIEWKWNSLTSGTGFKISSNSTGATAYTQKLFEISLSGANASGSQVTYGATISNTHTGSNSTNYGLIVTTSGASTNVALKLNASGGSINSALDIPSGNIQMTTGNFIKFNASTQQIGYSGGVIQYQASSAQHFLISSNVTPVSICSSISGGYFSIARPSGSIHSLVFGGDYSGSSYRSELTSCNTIIGNGGTLSLCANASLAGTFGVYTPNEVLKVKPTTALNLKSITSTSASAITPAEGDIVFVNDTNGTFTSIGFWGYENGAWHKF